MKEKSSLFIKKKNNKLIKNKFHVQTSPIDLPSNYIPFGAKSIGKVFICYACMTRLLLKSFNNFGANGRCENYRLEFFFFKTR